MALGPPLLQVPGGCSLLSLPAPPGAPYRPRQSGGGVGGRLGLAGQGQLGKLRGGDHPPVPGQKDRTRAPSTCVCVCACTGMGVWLWAPGLTLFAPRACVASLTHTQATDCVATPMAWAAGTAPAAVGSPVPVVTGCNTARVSLHRPGQARGLLLAPAPPPQALGPRPPTSLAAEAGPPRGTAAVSGCWVAVPVVGTGAPQLAARPKPACRARCRMGQGQPVGWLGRRPGADRTQVGGPRTHSPGSGCPCNRGGTGRLRSQAHRRHHAHTQGRSPGSQAPSGPRDNLDTPPQAVSLPRGLAGPV